MKTEFWNAPAALLKHAVAAICCALTASAAAQDWRYDGAELARFAADYERLRDSGASTEDPGLAARVAYFTGFVLGVARANADRGWYCLPEDLVAGQTWDAVARLLRDYPTLAQARPSTIVNGALSKAFPCSEAERAARKPEDKPAAEDKPRPKPKPKAAPKPAP
jgi:hypothetical protein